MDCGLYSFADDYGAMFRSVDANVNEYILAGAEIELLGINDKEYILNALLDVFNLDDYKLNDYTYDDNGKAIWKNGIPENKILTSELDNKPTLRPTAKERITSAMQNLSDVLRAPRGLSRERTMKLRAQSRNLTGDPNLKSQSPLELTRFDRESSEKTKIMQMARRGFPASAIASSLKIPQEKVEAVIKEAMG